MERPWADGWQSAGPEFGTGDPMYCVENGIVYLSGSMHQPTPGYYLLAGIAYPQASTAWQPLGLQSGWTAATNTPCLSGAPLYYASKGTVYLSGAITSSQFASGLIAPLPAAAWPTHTLYIKHVQHQPDRQEDR